MLPPLFADTCGTEHGELVADADTKVAMMTGPIVVYYWSSHAAIALRNRSLRVESW